MSETEANPAPAVKVEVVVETVEDVEKAVTAFKLRLDNNPTDWCGIKPVTNTKTIAIHSPSSEKPIKPDGSDTPTIVK